MGVNEAAMNEEDKAALLEKDRNYLWHHISPHNENPMVIVSGEGSWLTDMDGNRYFDGMSGMWCVNVGHGRVEIAEAAAEQMKTVAYATLIQSHIPAIELAAKLNEWLIGDYRFFSPTQVQMPMKSPSKSAASIIINAGRALSTNTFHATAPITAILWGHLAPQGKRSAS